MSKRVRQFYPVLRSEIDEIVCAAICFGALGALTVGGVIVARQHWAGWWLAGACGACAILAALACLRVLRRISRETYFEGEEAFRQDP